MNARRCNTNRTTECAFCLGSGQVEEFTCPLCQGDGYLERPAHPNTFNATPDYQITKQRRRKTKRQRNTVALTLIGLADFKRSSDEAGGA